MPRCVPSRRWWTPAPATFARAVVLDHHHEVFAWWDPRRPGLPLGRHSHTNHAIDGCREFTAGVTAHALALEDCRFQDGFDYVICFHGIFLLFRSAIKDCAPVQQPPDVHRWNPFIIGIPPFIPVFKQGSGEDADVAFADVLVHRNVMVHRFSLRCWRHADQSSKNVTRSR